ncbi:FecR family protein [uncultured Bacteroides sp.]|uniref:FecR family protein n=1 Tax=uncultured Bacteroides sp. TaxID=162156 RepID=UPI002AA81A13|nr:FecR family protein [uncultured Bacteroides sp.]
MIDKRIKYMRDLIEDDKFIQWVICPSADLDLYWNKIMRNDPNRKNDILQLKRMIKNLQVDERSLSLEEKNMIWNNILFKSGGKKTPFYLIPWFRISIAVVLAIILGISYFIINVDVYDIKTDYQSAISQIVNVDKSKDIHLILSDNRVVIVDDKSNIVYDKSGNVYIGTLKICQDKAGSKNRERLNQLIVPYGKTLDVKFSDGTRACVNSGSRLIYPSVFKEKKREIYIDGEIYLKVTRNEKVPFFVKTDQMNVKVLGTSFNVSAYKNDDVQSVVLVIGSVSVDNEKIGVKRKIIPNQIYEYQKAKNKAIVENVDVYNYICWKYGFLHFRSEKLSNVLIKLQRYYDIPIEFNALETDNIRVSGKLDLKNDIENVLNVVATTAPVKYRMKNNSLKIDVTP